MSVKKLSEEQEKLVDLVLQGHNVLVDACIGSGKTTTIQEVCKRIPTNKRILYLTYNTLLKQDAKNKIEKELMLYRPYRNFEILNYNGYAYKYLVKLHMYPGIEEQIRVFNAVKPKIVVPDILLIDEYQDIKEDHAEMLRYIKSTNPNIQIIMVGDMSQKIYSNTALDVRSFVKEFMVEYKELSFTNCFRINKDLADMLGNIWDKEINGCNDDCIHRVLSFEEAVSFMKLLNPSQILCLGSKSGLMNDALNILEEECSEKFNKKTVYASIRDKDANIVIDNTTAVFTTFDSSKGMERDFCFVFDWTLDYWEQRTNKVNAEYEILKNLFCVAASRGKRGVIFIPDGKSELLTSKILKTPIIEKTDFDRDLSISEMYKFLNDEDKYACYNLLEIKEKKKKDKTDIDIKVTDELIDLSPCIGIYQEACFFKEFNMEDEYELFNLTSNNYKIDFNSVRNKSLDEQICTLISAETKQERYKTQVSYPIVSVEEKERLIKRLKTVFKQSEEVQVRCDYDLRIVNAVGFADVVKNNIVYELKFTSRLETTHYLQCAMYMLSLDIDTGILWNVRSNEMYEIKIKDKIAFLNATIKAITKGKIENLF